MKKFITILFMFLFTEAVWPEPFLQEHNKFPLISALKTGTAPNGTIFYLCLAKLFSITLPGKTWAGYRHCNVPYAGKEYLLSEFTVPDQREFGNFSWSHDLNSAIVIGKDITNRPVFVCRAEYDGSMQPGITWKGYHQCNITHAGHVVIMNNYQVLTGKEKAIVHTLNPKNVQSH